MAGEEKMAFSQLWRLGFWG
ncbi:uncharacterized protein G2W53_007896 [Senna tora]|uniref:Uncharacterized protein n=1 Tax=Senna tora TaxID=362788 RepID=A0A835CEQ1_9FABA|nr:uncharacterized protein G2W53_007896 [Senna tora]